MHGNYPVEAMYANEEIPQTLIERLRCQAGNKKLDLSLCNLKQAPVDSIRIYFGATPEWLDLSYNSIRYITPKFSVELVNITKLDLSTNQIKKLPDNFGNLRDLIYLDIHKNKLETLPLSMGEMTRLQYLRLSNNPFRAPLKDFLGKEGRNLNGTALAELVVSFLQEVEVAHSKSPPPTSSNISSTTSLTRSRRSSRLHYRKRSSTTKGLSSKDSSDSDVDGTTDKLEKDPTPFTLTDPKPFPLLCKEQPEKSPKFNEANQSQEPAVSGPFARIGRFCLLATLWIVIVPILLAYFMDTLYLDNFVQDYPNLRWFWRNHYKSVHEFVTPVADRLPRIDAFYLRGPPPPMFEIHTEKGGIFSWLPQFMKDLF